MVEIGTVVELFGRDQTDLLDLLAQVRPLGLSRFINELLACPDTDLVYDFLHKIDELDEALDVKVLLHWVLYYRLRFQLGGLSQRPVAVIQSMSGYSYGSASPFLRQLPLLSAIYGRNQPGPDKQIITTANLFPGRYMWPLAFLGVGQPLLSHIIENDPPPDGSRFGKGLADVQLVNAVVCCQTDLAVSLMEKRFVQRPLSERGEVGKALQGIMPMLWFSQRVLDGQAVDGVELSERFKHSIALGPYGRDLHRHARLQLASSDEAERILRRYRDRVHVTTIDSYVCLLAVRSALLLGDADSAYELLRYRSQSGFAFYQDDLHWMRYHLLVGDANAALTSYRRAKEGANYHQARNRLECELRMAREVSMEDFADMCLLSRSEETPSGMHNALPSSKAQALDELLLGQTPAIRRIKRELPIMASSSQALLIEGPTGSGKDLLARLVHDLSGVSGQFVAINCATISDTLLEAELFGHRQGSYTGATGDRPGLIATATNGTLFLDEIGDTTARFQAALLRLLENGEYRPLGSDAVLKSQCRIIAATNRKLEDAIATGQFRQDLFYRLQQLAIEVPSLDQRRADIPLLARSFIKEACEDRQAPELADDLLQAWRQMSWPGNVRQLQNEAGRLALFFSSSSRIDLSMYKSLGHEDQENDSRLSVDKANDLLEYEEEAATRPQLPPGLSKERRPQEATQPGLGIGNPQMARRNAIVELFQQHQQLTRKQIAQVLRYADGTVTKYLKQLAAEGIIKKVMPSGAPATHYFVLVEQSAVDD